MDYKNTLNILETAFEMRGNLKEKDPLFLSYWKKHDLYKKLSTREGEEFILHDGPPYANGSLHAGHALNKILKDIVVRRAALEGKKINFLLGWDTHGLPIEHEVQKTNENAKSLPREEYVQLLKEYALSQVANQKEQFKKFALLTDFDHEYLTLKPEFEAKEVNVFHQMLNKGLAYQSLKPVHWSWSSKTALAEAEIEYKDVESNSIFVKFKHEHENFNVLIWTTTPWTLFGNVALAFGEKINYSLVEIDGDRIVMASELIKKLEETIGKHIKVIDNHFNLSKVLNTHAINPLNGHKSKLVIGHHVTTTDGTGIVHIAGGHGEDDYLIAKNNNLPIVVVVDEAGHMINAGDLNGTFYLKAEPLVMEKLGKNLLFHLKLKHSYPVDWRTKKPIVFRATEQWFVSIDKIKHELIKSINNVNWTPSWGKDRMSLMMSQRQDWCISRQRVWGVPITIIYDEHKKPIVDKELQHNIEEVIRKHGAIGWYKTDIKDLLPKHIHYKEGFRKETDILDVWFDSGSSHYAVFGDKIVDLYLEGTDQYRGWFNSSLITSQVVKHQAPYKKVLSHGFVVDGKGNKMSKSQGNGIDPLDISNKDGADILRLWVGMSDFTDDVKLSDNILEQTRTDYRKIRNTIKFLLSNLKDFDYKFYDPKTLPLVFQAVISEIQRVKKDEINYFNNYQFHRATKELLYQISNGVFAYFFDFAKDILYIEKPDSLNRRHCQFVLFLIYGLLTTTFAPIIPVTMEEAFNTHHGKDHNKHNEMSVFELKFDKPMPETKLNASFEELSKIRDVINKELEIARAAGSIKRSQEASVTLHASHEFVAKWKHENLAQIFMVAHLDIHEGELSAKVAKLEGHKCERCWNTILQTNMFDNQICKRCKHNL